MLEWIQTYAAAFWWTMSTSLAVFIAALIIVPLIVIRIPSDYFASQRRPKKYKVRHQSIVLWLLLLMGKNVIGGVLVMAGIAMLVLPGQGVLTILLGITLMNFPGKFQLERWIVSRGPILRFINRLRHRRGRSPLVLEEDPNPDETP